MAVMNRLDAESAPPHQPAEILKWEPREDRTADRTGTRDDDVPTDKNLHHLRHNWQPCGEVRCG
jgi:hypothetical protein